MSDAKWVKTLAAITGTASGVTRFARKSMFEEGPGPLEHIDALRPIPYAPGHVDEAHPQALRDIEWIRFPRRYRTTQGVGHFVPQNVETLADEIQAAAHAKLELDKEALWLFGYTGLLPEATWTGRSGTTGSRSRSRD